MGAVKFQKGTEEWQMFMDLWELCQRFWEPEESDKYWAELIKAADEFHKKYNRSFSKMAAAGLAEDCDMRSRKDMSKN